MPPKKKSSPPRKKSAQKTERKKAKTSSTKAEMKRFARRAPVEPIRKALAVDRFPVPVPGCSPAVTLLNDALKKGCELRSEFVIEAERPCGAGSAQGPAAVDLVVLIDTSGSMQDEASDLSAAAQAAISAAQTKCPSDLRVCWFGIEGVWANTRFTQSYRNYLKGQITSNRQDCRYSGTPVPDSDIRGYPGDREDGAAAIMDLAEHFDWRPGATRAIFYLGDEALERGGPQDTNDYAAADAAIAVAHERGVTLFTYYGTPGHPETAAETSAEYRRLATETGGQFYTAPADSVGGFQAILEEIICASRGTACQPFPVPQVRPCFTLQWGDGPADRIETDDVELMCLTVRNPYSNVTFKDLTVLIALITDADGSAVDQLPDGTASVYVKPLYLACFGDIPPCKPDAKDSNSSVSREIVLVSRGAKEGKYILNLAYCYSVQFAFLDLERFEIELVKS